jgi:hypothetical protein
MSMKAWIPISLALLLAQAPPAPRDEEELDTTPPVTVPPGLVEPEPPIRPPGPDLPEDAEPGITFETTVVPEPAGPRVQPIQEDPEAPRPSEEMRRLRTRLQQFEARLQEEETETRERLETVEQFQDTLRDRSLQLQQLQQERLVNLERAYGWFVTAEGQLDVGDLDAALPALARADEALEIALSSALETGRAQTATLIESARDRVAFIRQALDERDVYHGRRELEFAALEVLQAWRLALNRPEPTYVTP